MSLSLTIDRLFNASPETLYKVWTDSTHLSRWFGVKVEAEPVVGGTIRFHFDEECGPNHGTYLTLNPFHYLAFSWNSGSGSTTPDTTVHVTLKKENDGTRLTLRHEGFLNQKDFDAHDEGWMVYMELWNMLINIRPDQPHKTTISETFTSEAACVNAFKVWFGNDNIKTSSEAGGIKRVAGDKFEARLAPCRFGVCLALAEWGFANDAERAAARKTWENRFATLKKDA